MRKWLLIHVCRARLPGPSTSIVACTCACVHARPSHVHVHARCRIGLAHEIYRELGCSDVITHGLTNALMHNDSSNLAAKRRIVKNSVPSVYMSCKSWSWTASTAVQVPALTTEQSVLHWSTNSCSGHSQIRGPQAKTREKGQHVRSDMSVFGRS